jgi:FkbM family methyltransferase
MISAFKETVKSLLLRSGIVISRTPGQFNLGGLRLLRLRESGFRCQLAVDGGAADGGWTREFHHVFPESAVLCIEPRDDCQSKLRTAVAPLPHVTIAQTLLGAEEGIVELHEHADQSSILNNSSGLGFGTTMRRQMTTLDAVVRKHGLPWPDLIKLDLQGAELLCLQGAVNCLEHTEVVILEVSFIPFYSGNPLIGDVVPFMSDRGFQCYDIAGLWRRPLDNALAQGDFFFVKKASQLVADPRWSTTSAWS